MKYWGETAFIFSYKNLLPMKKNESNYKRKKNQHFWNIPAILNKRSK